jgi:hypothetical protein
MGAAATTSMKRLTPQAIFDRWETLFNEVSCRS